MPIQEQNIVFVESQVMDDVPEGGGAATGTVIVDGAMNNVFPDISDLDRALGRFNLRKLFVAVRTLDTDLYGGAKTVVTALPTDEAIGYTLFSTDDPFDTRDSAADRVAAYLNAGAEWAGYLLENHVTGQRTVQLFQRPGAALPPIGRTLYLVQAEGQAGEVSQYVRVIDVASEVRTYTYSTGNTVLDYDAAVVTCTLSDPLRHDFGGSPASRLFARDVTKTKIRDTVVADAARYYGTQRLTQPAAVGDLTVRAASIFTQLVPSAQTETPLVNQPMAPELTTTVSGGERSADVVQQAHTLALPVTVESRALNVIQTLSPIPAPGASSLAFRAQGAWYVLTDNGTGVMAASDPSIGVGTLDYTTGALAVTLGALPDAGSQIMLAWASPVHYAVRAGATADAGATLDLAFRLAHAPIIPGTVSLAYPVGGVNRSATDPAADGNLTGTGVTGTLNYATGDVTLRFTTPPDRAAAITCAYSWRDGADLVATGPTAVISGGQFTVPGAAPFRAGGKMTLIAAIGASSLGAITASAYITPGGQVRVSGGQTPEEIGGKHLRWDDQAVGTFDIASGVVTLSATIAVYFKSWLSDEWRDYQDPATITGVADIAVERDTAAYDPNAVTGEQVNPSAIGLTLNLLTTVADTVVVGSVRFRATGKTYDDRAGTLYADIDQVTGSGTPAGSIDYAIGRATLTWWADAQSAAISVLSCLTRHGQWGAVQASLRTALAPLKTQSLQIIATTLDGEQITGSADGGGVIAAAWMRGTVGYEVGVAAIEFGQLVDGVWTPRQVDPSTIRYNAVAYKYLPLPADILGIDPVRLPPDGRVPIFRAGDVALVLHTAETAPQTVSSGGTIDCGRTRLAWVRVLDAAGAAVATGYSLDRAGGIVTIDDASGMTMPVTVRHTVADLRLLTDVQITGDITLARPLSHDYPAGEALLAGCLLHGDRRARVSAVWDQQTWDGTWADSISGSEATATLDVIAHPVEVTNEGAETERWLLRWTSTTNVELIGQTRGLVYSGPFTADIAPVNPRTRAADGSGGVPYLRIPVAANGGGWSAGNVVRINTVGAIADLWIARAIQQSDEPAGDGADGCELYALGNIDRP